MIQIPGKGLLLGVARCDSRRSSNGSWKFRAVARVSNKNKKRKNWKHRRKKAAVSKSLSCRLARGGQWLHKSAQCTQGSLAAAASNGSKLAHRSLHQQQAWVSNQKTHVTANLRNCTAAGEPFSKTLKIVSLTQDRAEDR